MNGSYHHSRDWQFQEAKSRLSALVDAVEQGHEQVITRHGKPVAVVVPVAAWESSRLAEQRSLYSAMRSIADAEGLPEVERTSDDDGRRIPDFGPE